MTLNEEHLRMYRIVDTNIILLNLDERVSDCLQGRFHPGWYVWHLGRKWSRWDDYWSGSAPGYKLEDMKILDRLGFLIRTGYCLRATLERDPEVPDPEDTFPNFPRRITAP